jgi:hypothetical protein
VANKFNKREIAQHRASNEHRLAQMRWKSAVFCKEPVPDYDEPKMSTWLRLLFADGDRPTDYSMLNTAERFLAKAKSDPAYRGRGQDESDAKHRLWRTHFPPAEMLTPQGSLTSTPAGSTTSSDPSESDTSGISMPDSSEPPATCSDESPDTQSDSSDSGEEADAPLPDWADLFTQESLSRDSTWAMQNHARINSGHAKRRHAPSEMAWFLANLLNDDKKTFLQVVFKKAEQWAEEQRKRDAAAEAESRERRRGDVEVLELLDYLEAAESGAHA